MTALFFTVLEISLALSPLIIFVLVAAPFFEQRYSPKFQYLLWLVLAVRFAIVWTPSAEEKPLSIPIPQTSMIEDLNNPDWLSPMPDFVADKDTNAMLESAGQGAVNTLSFLQVVAFVWVGGAGIFLLYHLCAYACLYKNVRRHCSKVENEILSGQFQSIKKELGISKNIGLFMCASVHTPMLIGFMRPRIVLHSHTSPSSQTGMILRHELIHFKRRDLWAKLLLLWVRAVYWFNPLIHIMARQTNRAIELCCDADVLRLANDGQRKDYGLAILKSLEQKIMPASVLHSGFSDGKRQMKKRFQKIISQPPARMGWSVICFVLILSFTFSGFVSVVPKDAAEPDSFAFMSPDLMERVLEKKALNPNTIGWLNIPDTSLNDPILFNPEENNNYYLRIGFDGRYNANGSCFSDYRSIFGSGSRDEFGRNTTLYGFSRDDDPDGELFSQLKKYKDPEFARTHPYIFFSTEKENIWWEVFAVFYAHVDLPYILSEPQDMSVEELTAAIRASSIYHYDVSVNPQDRVLTLTTAVYSVDGLPDLSSGDIMQYRFVVVAKMLPPNGPVKSEAAFELNPNPVSPDTFQYT